MHILTQDEGDESESSGESEGDAEPSQADADGEAEAEGEGEESTLKADTPSASDVTLGHEADERVTDASLAAIDALEAPSASASSYLAPSPYVHLGCSEQWLLVPRLLGALVSPLPDVVLQLDGERLAAYSDALGTLFELCAFAAASAFTGRAYSPTGETLDAAGSVAAGAPESPLDTLLCAMTTCANCILTLPKNPTEVHISSYSVIN